MSDDDDFPGRAVPSARLARLFGMGRMTGGLAGRALRGGAGKLAAGRRPRIGDLMMTPANARAVTEELARMRGAAMKVGQLVSMEAEDLLPPDLAAIFARLQADADPMPPRQLREVLTREWGDGWQRRFARFDVRPVASASIGQVHRATTRDGRNLAIKVQYPGVRGSIDSDIRNIAAILRVPGLVPRQLNLAPLLEEARAQLHEEADYLREGSQLEAYADVIGDDPRFVVPRLHPELSTRDILAMDYLESVPLGTLADGPQEVRDDVAARLIDLVLRELFEFRLMQTDPNFGNYRRMADGRIALLDFGATQVIPDRLSRDFHALMQAGLSSDREASRAAAIRVGLFDDPVAEGHRETILDMFAMTMAPMLQDGPFDFGQSDLMARMRLKGAEIGEERDFWHVPPTETLFVQRKVVGTYLLATRLKARVDLKAIAARYR
ncbi:AarF/ABC1/UbiB kinase family protein [Palleronia sp. LCG004]|uniref:ABC1 kinase family protein n=1 Tax=Palleronia sp. LCG004 TaxID=3079304 RepID=UPI00294284A9|nr:AarF/ABC1/UbiB kinase family protein [Palleronia sp. LCG004]WOI55746.1 AarF/ABC1/UbiB kinase family protein [Palleronia sp. LCG004]